MNDDKEKILVTDAYVIRLEVKGEQLMALAKMARARKDEFDASIAKHMTAARAKRIKALREGGSWRSVAGQTHEDWGKDADWTPVTNQLAGMALCEQAAAMLGEDPSKEPWN